MDETINICGRQKEIKEICNFISSRIQNKKSGLLYLTGPPGTGKTMTIGLVLDQFADIPRVKINCLRVKNSKLILQKLCNCFSLEEFTKFNETEMIERLSKKFASRSSKAHILVLDELDQLPQSKNADLVRSIFAWPNQTNSRLIVIGIANSVNLTSRYQVASSLIGKSDCLTKVLFRPYNSTDIRAILEWYLEHDENYEDEVVEPKALEMIAKKFARENGDIRGALNALKDSIDDRKREKHKIRFDDTSDHYPTPPSTPPMSPCKEKTNLASVANSCKKRQRKTNYTDDTTPFAHQLLLACIMKLCSDTKNNIISARACKDFVKKALRYYEVIVPDIEYQTMLETLELQGFLSVKKGRPLSNIVLKASEAEIIPLLQRSHQILEAINKLR